MFLCIDIYNILKNDLQIQCEEIMEIEAEENKINDTKQ